MKKLITYIIVCVTMLSLIVCGCSASKKPAPKPAPAPPNRVAPSPNSLNPTPPSPAPTPTPARKVKPSAPNTLAKKLANTAKKVDGVKSATVVVTDSVALVGLEINPKIEAKKTDEIKSKVAKAVMKADPSLKNVNVTTDPNLFTRIDKVAKGVAAGKPVSSFADELKEITRRITPKTKVKK
jgi:YhcN/YlaJ family sporulation lipoprotein